MIGRRPLRCCGVVLAGSTEPEQDLIHDLLRIQWMAAIRY